MQSAMVLDVRHVVRYRLEGKHWTLGAGEGHLEIGRP